MEDGNYMHVLENWKEKKKHWKNPYSQEKVS